MIIMKKILIRKYIVLKKTKCDKIKKKKKNVLLKDLKIYLFF